jgi:murein tripeptide amidase MpaA
MIRISAAFDGGNIEVEAADEAADIRLRIRDDHESNFKQWFYFRLTGAKGRACTLKVVNAGEVSYKAGFRDYQAVASYDREHWFRVPTGYDDATLTIDHTPDRDSVYYAYFAPYSMERHADLVARIAQRPGVTQAVLGATLDGQDLDLVTVGEPGEGKRVIWAIARQHPGETMAEWWMEGWLERLTDPADAVARALRDKAVFHVVANMNPDGSRRGHLRTNAAGVNLNREWAEPSMAKSPEVFLVRERMRATGVDCCFDVHGDEALPHNFIAGFEGIPSLTKPQLKLLNRYRDALAGLTPDFQTKKGYPKSGQGKANLAMCTNWVAETFGCLAMTLEQPFKDASTHPLPETGWSPARCQGLARACLDALHAVIDDLR